MSDVIDTAAWTGRDWDNKIIASRGLFKGATILLWLRRDRDHQQGTFLPAWGGQIGYDIISDWWSVEVCWNKRMWVYVFFTSQRLYELRFRKAAS